MVLATVADEKVSLIVAAAPDANQSGIKAGELIKSIAPHIGGGSGGGRPDMAQAGGKKPRVFQMHLPQQAFLADK